MRTEHLLIPAAPAYASKFKKRNLLAIIWIVRGLSSMGPFPFLHQKQPLMIHITPPSLFTAHTRSTSVLEETAWSWLVMSFQKGVIGHFVSTILLRKIRKVKRKVTQGRKDQRVLISQNSTDTHMHTHTQHGRQQAGDGPDRARSERSRRPAASINQCHALEPHLSKEPCRWNTVLPFLCQNVYSQRTWHTLKCWCIHFTSSVSPQFSVKQLQGVSEFSEIPNLSFSDLIMSN